MTSDIQQLFVQSSHLTVAVLYTGVTLRTLAGHLGFWTIFILVELSKLSMSASFAILNVATFIQMSFILNLQWVYKYDDKES